MMGDMARTHIRRVTATRSRLGSASTSRSALVSANILTLSHALIAVTSGAKASADMSTIITRVMLQSTILMSSRFAPFAMPHATMPARNKHIASGGTSFPQRTPDADRTLADATARNAAGYSIERTARGRPDIGNP